VTEDDITFTMQVSSELMFKMIDRINRNKLSWSVFKEIMEHHITICQAVLDLRHTPPTAETVRYLIAVCERRPQG
jgi:hypothetical protein